MMPISGVSAGAVQPMAAAGGAPGASRVQKPEEEVQNRQMKPVMDEYVRSESREPSGRRRMDEVWECNTDKADREIERLEKKRQELEQRLNTETGEARARELERQLALVEQEVKQKDSDTYRRQQSTFTRIS